MNSLAENLKKLEIELDRLSKEEKDIVMKKVNTNPEILPKLYRIINDYIEG